MSEMSCRGMRLHPLSCALLSLFSVGSLAAEPEAPTLSPVRVEAHSAADEPPSERSGRYAVRRSRSATGLNLGLQETPQSVSVLTRAEMNDFRLDSVNEALAASSGVMVEKVETDRTYYTARGFDITTFQLDGVGVPFAYGNVYGNLDTALYDRVEVVYGANGLSTGTGYPAATVNFVRKRPTPDFQASAGLKLGSWNSRRLDGDVSGALVESGRLRGRLVVAHEDTDSYLDRYGHRKSLVYGVLEADLGPDTLLTLGHSEQYNAARSPLWGGLPMFNTDGSRTQYARSASTAANWAYWDSSIKTSFAELSHALNPDWQLQARLSRSDQVDDSALLYVSGTPSATTGLGVYSYPSRYNMSTRQDLADARVMGGFDWNGLRQELSAGVSWSRSALSDVSHYGQGIGTPLPSLAGWQGDYAMPSFDAFTNGSRFATVQRSAFMAARLRPVAPLQLIAGARATASETGGVSYSVSRSSRASEVTPYAGLVYALTPDWNAYLSETRIFNPQYQQDAQGNFLDPVRGRSTETGLKGRLLGLDANLALFKTRQRNLAEFAGSVGAISYYSGIDAESTGFQFDLAGQLTPQLEGRLGYTQLSIHDDAGQNVRTYTPRRLLRASATYQVPGLPGLKLGTQVSHQGDVYAFYNGWELRQKAYTLVDLMASYALDRQWTVSLNLRNLTDEKYLSSLYWGSYGQGYYGAPRNLSVALNWRY
jgi:outer-membrane receptor for ferric coprogen and ferric-rhodotorulic acid